MVTTHRSLLVGGPGAILNREPGFEERWATRDRSRRKVTPHGTRWYKTALRSRMPAVSGPRVRLAGSISAAAPNLATSRQPQSRAQVRRTLGHPPSLLLALTLYICAHLPRKSQRSYQPSAIRPQRSAISRQFARTSFRLCLDTLYSCSPSPLRAEETVSDQPQGAAGARRAERAEEEAPRLTRATAPPRSHVLAPLQGAASRGAAHPGVSAARRRPATFSHPSRVPWARTPEARQKPGVKRSRRAGRAKPPGNVAKRTPAPQGCQNATRSRAIPARRFRSSYGGSPTFRRFSLSAFLRLYPSSFRPSPPPPSVPPR